MSRILRIAVAVLVGTFLMAPLTAPSQAATATETFTGSIDAGGAKWRTHTIEVSATRTITATLDWDDATADLNLGLQDPNGGWVTWASSQVAKPEVISWTLEPGTWTFGISAKAGSANYTLTVQDQEPPPATEPGHDHFEDAVDSAATNWRTHTFEVSQAGTISATLDWDNTAADLNLGLRDPSGTWVQWAASTTAKPERIVHSTVVTGTWTLGVSAKSGSAAYVLDVYHSGSAPPSPTDEARYVTSFGYGPNEAGHAGLYAYGFSHDATDDTILVGDLWNRRVLRFTRDGQLIKTVSTRANPGELGGTGEPFDVEAGPDGSVWVANEAQSRVVQFDHDGNWIKTIGLGGGPESFQNYARGCGGGKLYWPTNIAIHPHSHDLYISDGFCRDVSVFDSAGRFKFVFGLNLTDVGISQPTPRGIDFDDDGNLWLAEHKSRRIFKYSAAGERLLTSPRQDDMMDPRGLSVDSARGLVYVAAAFENELFKWTTAGTIVSKWSGAGSTQFDSIRYVAVAPDGDVYTGDTWGSYRAWRLRGTDGAPLTWNHPAAPPPDGGFNQVSGIGVDPGTGRLFAADTFENRVQGFNTSAHCLSAGNCPAFELAFGSRQTNKPNAPGFNYPRGLTVGGGSVWIDAGQAIVRYDLNGNFISRFGQWGSGPGQFKAGPMGIRVVPDGPDSGRVYTTDTGNCRIQVLDYDGNQLSEMGSCGTGTDQMRNPWQLDVEGELAFVADANRNRIAVWDLSTRTIIRSITPTIDGVALSRPHGVVVDPSGQWLYIADTGNVRIVRTRLDGTGAELVTKGKDTPESFFRWPRYVEFGPDGRLYVSDFNQRVYTFTVPQ